MPLVAPARAARLEWYCVRTLHELEQVADKALRAAGFEVFLPMTASASLADVLAGAKSVFEPLFLRYLFVRFDRADPAWREINRMRGVEAVLGVGSTPAALPDEAIDLLRGSVSENGCRYLAQPRPRDDLAGFRIGSAVTLVDGPYAGFVGIVERSRSERVRILMTIFGHSNVVHVGRHRLRAV